MPSAQVRNASMQQLNSADLLDVEDRNFGAEWYDGVGGTSFLGTTVVPLGTEKLNSAPEFYSMASNILTIAEAGLYLFNFAVTGEKSGTNELIMAAQLEEDSDTTVFAAVPGTVSYTTWFTGWGTLHNSSIIQVGINYRYRLTASRPGGSVTPTFLQNCSKLSVVRLFKNG